MKEKVQLVHDLDCNVADLEEAKIEYAHQFQNVTIKERQNTKKADAKLYISLLNMAVL